MGKKIALIIAGLLGVAIVVALVAPFFISTDTYKDQIIARVEAATGRKMTIEGPLSLRFFPIAGITAETITLSNPLELPEFKNAPPLLTLKKLQVDIAVLPLLDNKIVIKDFVLDEPQINLQADKDGKQNWVFAKQDKSYHAPAPAPSPEKGAKAGVLSSLPKNLMLSNFTLKNGTLAYMDASDAKKNMTLKQLNASMTLSSAATAALIEGSGEWNGKTVTLKGGVGTLQSMLEQQKMEFDVTLKNDLLSFVANGNYDKGTITGKSNVKTTSIKDLATWLDPAGKPLATPAKLAFAADSDIHCFVNYCDFSNVHLKLDDVQAKGAAKINFANNVPSVMLDMQTDRLDFNPFLPEARHASLSLPALVADALAEPAGHWSDAPIDATPLKSVSLNATIQAGGIMYRKITIGKTVLKVTLEQGDLNAAINDAVMYSGMGTVSARINASQSPPAFEAHAVLKAVQMEPLLKDAADFDRVSGVADVDVTAKSSGGSEKAIVSALSGDGKIKLANGVIKRVNIADMLHNTAAAFTDAGSKSKDTAFTQIAGSFTIAQGVISNHDLTAEIQGLNVAGEGMVNLPAYTVNYHLSPKLVTTAQDKTTGATTSKEGLAVPVIIEGSLDKPTFRPDLNAALQNALSNPKQFKEQLKNSKAALKDQLKGSGGGLKNLKGLLNGLGGN